MDTIDFNNSLFQELTAYNSSLKDLISEFEKTKLSLSFVDREVEALDPFICAKIEKNTKLDKKTKAYLILQLKKKPKSSSPFYEMRRWGTIEDLNNLVSNCENFLSLCNSIHNNPHFEKLPVSFSICEGMEVIEDWRVCCKTEFLDYADGRNYEDFWKYKNFLERVSIFVSGCFSKTTERLSHISKIVNSYIESMALTAATQGEKEAEKTTGTVGDTSSKTDDAIQIAGQDKISENIFKKNGDFWMVRFNGKPSEPVAIKDSVGMGYIHKLLDSKKPISAMELACQKVNTDLLRNGENLASQDPDDDFGDGLTTVKAEGLADNKTLQDVNRRLKEIPAEIDDAKKNSDDAKVARLEKERDGILAYLKQTLKPGSHTAKTFETEAKKTADTVRKAIDRAIESIQEKKPNVISEITEALKSLGIHLDAIKQNGVDFSYTPDREMNWEL